jgi:hypothetical protein
VAAITASGIAYRFSAIEKRGQMDVDCTVESFFYPDASWYRPELADDNILSHEQLNFDISELFARKMRARISTYRFTSNVKAEMRRIYEDIIREMQSFQERYDKETNYSRSVEKQQLWNAQIRKALEIQG